MEASRDRNFSYLRAAKYEKPVINVAYRIRTFLGEIVRVYPSFQ